MTNLKPGLHCKACNSPLADIWFDPELCQACMAVVTELNADLDPLEDSPELVFDDEEDDNAPF